jgi:hypothetical protein
VWLVWLLHVLLLLLLVLHRLADSAVRCQQALAAVFTGTPRLHALERNKKTQCWAQSGSSSLLLLLLLLLQTNPIKTPHLHAPKGDQKLNAGCKVARQAGANERQDAANEHWPPAKLVCAGAKEECCNCHREHVHCREQQQQQQDITGQTRHHAEQCASCSTL